MRWCGWLAAIVGAEVLKQELQIGIRRPVQRHVEGAPSVLARQVSQSEVQSVAKRICRDGRERCLELLQAIAQVTHAVTSVALAVTPSRRQTNERASNVAQQWPTLGRLATAGTRLTSPPTPGTVLAHRGARLESALLSPRPRGGNAQFTAPPAIVRWQLRRRSAHRYPAGPASR
jgi:hypothetical protein